MFLLLGVGGPTASRKALTRVCGDAAHTYPPAGLEACLIAGQSTNELTMLIVHEKNSLVYVCACVGVRVIFE